MAEFKESYDWGTQVQELFLGIIREKYPCAVAIPGKFKGYDVWIPEKNISVEIKSDLRSNHTGNFVVEIEMNGSPSGLSTTTADYWAFFDGDAFILIQPKKIYECILFNKLIFKQFIGAGDSVPKKAFLVSKKMLLAYAASRLPVKNKIYEAQQSR